MNSGWTVRLTQQIYASWKLCLSLRKHDWKLNDYPVSIRAQAFNPEYSGARFKQHRYIAYIVNWTLAGFGDTRQEARCELETNFEMARVERKRQGKPLPRPGTRAPIEFASQERVSTHPELADDFIGRVLELDWAWISDDSSLWDFHTRETNELLCAKIKEVYGVDVSDLESAKLSEILDRIAASQASAPVAIDRPLAN
jgi:hypothetical protein